MSHINWRRKKGRVYRKPKAHKLSRQRNKSRRIICFKWDKKSWRRELYNKSRMKIRGFMSHEEWDMLDITDVISDTVEFRLIMW
jgi:hypothetical protein